MSVIRIRRPGRSGASIGRRYVGFTVPLALLVAATCALLLAALVLSQGDTGSWRVSARTIAGVDALNRDLMVVETRVGEAIQADDSKPLRAIPASLGSEQQRANEVLASADTPAERALAARLQGIEEELIAAWFTPGVTWGGHSEAARRARQALLHRQVSEGETLLLAFAEANEQEAAARDHAASRTRRRLVLGAGVLLAFALALMLAAAIVVRRLVGRPARELQEAVSRVSEGDLETPVAVDGPLVLATIAEEFDSMRAALKAERVREAASRLESLNVVSGAVAHDFNNLLQAIIGQLEFLRDDVPEHARERLVDAERAAWKSARLASEMLIASGHGSYAQSPVAPAEIATALGPFAAGPARVSVEAHEEVPPLVGDRSQVREAVGAVVANACEAYAGAAGKVTVRIGCRTLCGGELERLTHSAAAPGEFVVFAVEDGGEGMAEPTMARAFDPFFSTRFAGRGLGLAVALGVVRGHRGAIDVRSAPGRGTVVQLFFPAATAV